MGRVLSLSVFLSLAMGLQAKELEWSDLQPEDWTLDRQAIFGGKDISQLSDFSPQAQRLMDRLQVALDQAPGVEDLEGQHVTIRGYSLPLQRFSGKAQRFFLLPYYGTCIHSPPPPANLILDVHYPKGTPYSGFFAEVEVTGILSLKSYQHRLATSAYRLEAESVERVEFDPGDLKGLQ